jgi:molybdenum cofactor biosynthesis enzyme MoaA
MNALLVNPPVYDFSAYDFWLKPYGLLNVAGALRGHFDVALFDYMDRLDPRVPPGERLRADAWGRGAFHAERIARPAVFENIPRYFHRHGLPRAVFQETLRASAPLDLVLVQTLMTYWYPGVRETIEDIRTFHPRAKIVLGGVYATICHAHAKTLGADFVLNGIDAAPLWDFVRGIDPAFQPAAGSDALPYWDLYPRLNTGVLKLADGCPFKCTYCSVPQVYPRFHARPLERSLAEFDHLLALGVENVVFYDDALLYQPERILLPFLREVVKRPRRVNFHTPNALNARFISKELAELMLEAGFKVVYLGFESAAYEWQKKTGGKVYSHELNRAVENLLAAGADPTNLAAYLIVAHPQNEQQDVEASMRFAHDAGLAIMLAEFSPIPGTPDGELCRQWVDLDEPLNHNKTAFPFRRLGADGINRLKKTCRELNQSLRKDRVNAPLPQAVNDLG